MGKFMFRASYTQQGLEGVIQEGFAARQAAVTALIEGAGGSVEAFYFAYGDDDVVGVLDGSEQTAIALSLAVNRTGAVNLSTIPLLTAEQMDAARTKVPDYRAPGS
ncbi:MAG: Uncharacterized protein, contains GYD domain [Chloroflexi bacterium]|jgi:uncharacterized protein with GYD domain|nr:MAG: Uncharacterized protein, contains GYD domain [Chloroflexota bacterium]